MFSLCRLVALIFIMAGLIIMPATSDARARKAGPVVLAAASLQEALSDAADHWAKNGHPRPVLSFAGSPALARQIEAGAPADLFISADEAWMNHVAAKGLIRKDSRKAFLTNRLVLITPVASTLRVPISPGFPLARLLGTNRFAMADPDSVPAGRYGAAALARLGVWPSVSGRLARAENVRAALALVERGEAPFGIVYLSDARASARVRVASVFPADSHPPIIYPLAVLRRSTHPDAEKFRHFLLSDAGKAHFVRRGFGVR